MALLLFFLEIAKTGFEVVRDMIQIALGIVTDIRVTLQRNTK